MARQPLTHVATVVEVLQKEGVCLREIVTVADLDWLGLFPYDYFKVHDFTCFGLLHLNGPGAWCSMLSHLFESLLFTHLKLEWFPEKIEQTRAASTCALTGFLLLT